MESPDRQRERVRTQTPTAFWMHALLAIACALAFSLCLSSAVPHEAAHAAKSSSEIRTAAATEFAYSGDVEDFINASGGQFGMYRRQEGSSISFANGKIVIDHIPKNTTIYKGFYLQADITDKKTWNKSLFIPQNDSGRFTFELDPAYAGKAWPIAPVKVSDETATTSGQYYLGVPTLDKLPGYMQTVKFVDETGKELSTVEVPYGGDVTPPTLPERKGYVLSWDKKLTGITQSTTIKAIWTEEGKTTYTVTFEDGFGKVLDTVTVAEGSSATAPADPTRDGYTFNGWKPATFSNIKANLTVVAQWLNNDEITVNAVLDAIAALPSDPKTLLGDTSNEAVASTAAAYNALSDELKSQIPDDKRLHLAECAIAVLPSDPFDITSDHKTPIATATAVVESLPTALQATLDSEAVSSSRTYGRYLENVSWALDALRKPNNVTLLAAGTYTGQVSSTLNWGKNDSARKLGFTVKSVTVQGGTATAILEHESNSSQTLRMGGVEYTNLQTDPAEHSYFEIPINLNSTFHFSVKGKNATDATDAISYEMTISANEATMTPDPPQTDDENQEATDPETDAGKKTDDPEKADDKEKDGGKEEGDKPEKSDEDPDDDAKTPGAGNPDNGGTGPGGAGGALTASGPTASSAGNLNSLIRASSVRASGEDPSSTAANESDTAGTAGKTAANATGSSADDKRITEVSMADGVAAAAKADLGPAVAGLALLFVSLGALLFSLRFVKRESALVQTRIA